jgi:hypothetical protein
MNSTMTSIITQTSTATTRLLPYPKDFFAKDGSPPTEDVAVLCWSFRKERPNENEVERVTPNATAMLDEMKTMRESLHNFILEEMRLGMKAAAQREGLVRPEDRQAVVTEKDLKGALNHLVEPNPENARIVFMVCHEFHRERQWLPSKVDIWLQREGMRLLSDSDNNKAVRKYGTDRGGFGTIARMAKAQAMSSITRAMQSVNNWSVSTTDKTRMSKRGHSYEKTGSCNNKYYIVRTPPNPDELVGRSEVRKS